MEKNESSSNGSSIVNASSQSKRKISDYFQFDDSPSVSLSQVISRMVAKDGLLFSIFVTSQDLRKGVGEIPKSSSTIKEYFMNFYADVKKYLIEDFKGFKNELAAITLDEWTSIGNHCYMNVNVYVNGQTYNLGLSRLRGSIPADSYLVILE